MLLMIVFEQHKYCAAYKECDSQDCWSQPVLSVKHILMLSLHEQLQQAKPATGVSVAAFLLSFSWDNI